MKLEIAVLNQAIIQSIMLRCTMDLNWTENVQGNGEIFFMLQAIEDYGHQSEI